MVVTGVLGWMWCVFMGADGYSGKLLGVGCQKKDTCDHGCLLWVGTVHGRTRKVTEKVDMRQRGRSVIIGTLHNHRPHS